MGVSLTIGGKEYQAESYNVSEDSTPTSADDSTGSVGTFSFTLKNIEDPFLLQGMEVSFTDSRRGYTIGTVNSVSETDRGTVSLSCLSRLGNLNIYGIQAQPFSGTLSDAFKMYAELADIETDIFIDPQIENRPVVFPGWFGELWYHLKQMASAQDCEISLVSGVLLLRPLRSMQAIDDRDTERARQYGGTTLAKAVEVYYYDSQPITNQLVYPPGGWTAETEVISVGAGETVTRTLELSASVTSIQQPVMQTFVGPTYDTSSVYTVVADDGLPVTPAMWRDYGGSLSVEINPDTTSPSITVTAPGLIVGGKGEPISTYSIALGSDYTGNRYSTLRIVGTGVAFDKQILRVRTCVPDKLTGTDVGITIDNAFIRTIDDARRAGVRAARWYAGEKMELRGTVTSINQLGDSGSGAYPKYSFDQDKFQGDTYGAVETYWGAATYGEILDQYYETVRNDFENQAFGNSAGSRVWDRKTNYWFRIRTSTLNPSTITFTAEDDIIHEDAQILYGGVTYAEEEGMFNGRTYSQRDRLGLRFEKIDAPEQQAFPSLTNFPSLDFFPEA